MASITAKLHKVTGLSSALNGIYVKCFVVGADKKQKSSQASSKTDSPVWSPPESFTFQCAPADTLQFDVRWNKSFGTDPVVGTALIKASDVTAHVTAHAAAPLVLRLDTAGTMELSFAAANIVDGPTVAEAATAAVMSPTAAQLDAAAPAASPANNVTIGSIAVLPSTYLPTDWRYAMTSGSTMRTDVGRTRPNVLTLVQPSIPDPSRKNLFLAGHQLQMTVCLEVGQPFVMARNLYVTFKGVAKGKVANLKMMSTKTKEEIIVARANLLASMQAAAGVDRVKLDRGKHSWPVVIDLPASLPTTVYLPEGSMFYKVNVEADLVNMPDLMVKQPITVVNPGDLSLAGAPGMATQKSMSKSPMGAGGTIEADVRMIKNTASVEEDLEFDMTIRNGSSRTIKKVTVQLRRFVYINGVSLDMNGDVVHDWDMKLFPKVLPGMTYKNRMCVELDEMDERVKLMMPISMARAKYECRYAIRVIVDIPGSRDAYAELPVRIAARDPSRPVSLRRALPTLEALATRLDPHPSSWSSREVEAWVTHCVPGMAALASGFRNLFVTGEDLLGFQDESYAVVAGAAGHPEAAAGLQAAVTGLLDAFLVPVILLERLSLYEAIDVFNKHQIRRDDLPYLTYVDLRGMGVPVGPAKRIMLAIGERFAGHPALAGRVLTQ